jgi:hypothetical protein
LSYIDEDDDEVSRILRQPAASSSPALATASPLATIKPDLGAAQEEEEDIAEAVEDAPADLCVAETLLLLASMTYTIEPLDAGASHVPVRPWADHFPVGEDERTSDEGLSVLCEGIDFLDSLPPCPGLDLLCSITRQVLFLLVCGSRRGLILKEGDKNVIVVF